MIVSDDLCLKKPPRTGRTNAPATSRRVFAFDFDGVLCDSLDEGLLISWNAHIGAPVTAFAEPGLAGVPLEMRERFRSCRPFTQHLGHWLVPFVVDPTPTSHAEFVDCYDALAGETVSHFTAAAADYRAGVRRAYPELWLAHHRIQPLVTKMIDDAYIVTARDTDSVSQILEAHGTGLDHSRIFGSRRAKQDALKAICVREAVAPAAVTLIDDSIENCLAADAAGYGAWWAEWGYTSVADEALATARGITRVSIDGLSRRVGSKAR
jgi:phosphoglycolate phosphatase-like HAD superfamily hydrolase